MNQSLFLLLAPIALVLASCGQTAAPSPTAGPKAGPATSLPSKAAWEERWDRVLGEARKEGSVVIYGTWSPDTRTSLTSAFKDKYGINLEFSGFGNGAAIAAKVQAEKNAGLLYADVIGDGPGTTMVLMKPQGLLGSLKPLLLLPEVLDPNAWRPGQLPFYDKDGTSVVMVSAVNRAVVYNTTLVREGELTSYRDLLKPQYKGKIISTDPSVSGNAVIAHLGYNLWGEADAAEFFRRLVKEQQAVITRDNRLHIESVARGKYAIGFAPSGTLIAGFLASGAPIKLALCEEDNRVTQGSGTVAVLANLAHPNATTVFVNWLLTKEGQTVYSRIEGRPSTRLDVSTEGMDPLFVPVAGKKYYTEQEGWLEARNKWMGITRKIMEEASK